MKATERRMFESPQLRAVICNSHMVKNEILEYFSLPPHKLHVIYNGVDAVVFHPSLAAAHRASLRQRLGWSDQDLVLLLVGSGFERKGVTQVLHAMRGLPPTTRLLVVGKDKRLGRYRRLAEALGLSGQVEFAGGQKDVLPYYGAADLFVMPALYEPFPNVIMEAMASGLPVVTSRKCGGAEFIDNGREGYVVDALDVPAIASAVQKLSDPAARQRAALAARARAESHTWAAMAADFNVLYRSLLAPAVEPARMQDNAH
jgi:UDP-glucose:(heptosyl)LPS alpha-1,3-glucosyltransferase